MMATLITIRRTVQGVNHGSLSVVGTLQARTYAKKKRAAVEKVDLDGKVPGTDFSFRQLKQMELERQQRVRKASKEHLALMRAEWAHEKKVSELVETYKARQRWTAEYQQHLSLEQMKAQISVVGPEAVSAIRQKQLDIEQRTLLKTFHYEKLEEQRQQDAATRQEILSVLEKGAQLFEEHPDELVNKQFYYAEEEKDWMHKFN